MPGWQAGPSPVNLVAAMGVPRTVFPASNPPSSRFRDLNSTAFMASAACFRSASLWASVLAFLEPLASRAAAASAASHAAATAWVLVGDNVGEKVGEVFAERGGEALQELVLLPEAVTLGPTNR